MNILFLGDIVGKVGRRTVEKHLADLKKEFCIDFTIANGENATHGKGLSLSHYQELIKNGIDCITMGNHFYRVSEIISHNAEYVSMIRPANFYKDAPGVGTKIFAVGTKTIRVTNLIGRIFIEGADSNPFDTLSKIIADGPATDVHFVDFHAEATGEKMSLAKAFDGQVTIVVGTHTHVQTADERILPKGTGFISDVGMCGLYDSVLGVCPEGPVERTWKLAPATFVIPEEGIGMLNGIVVAVDDKTNMPTSIKRINIIDSN
jgi:metallophosphoesterase (TIGR00282 family)